jgi:hypothetical protein
MRFAHLKTHHGFERLRLRGLSGARDEFHLAAIVQNLKTPGSAPHPATAKAPPARELRRVGWWRGRQAETSASAKTENPNQRTTCHIKRGAKLTALSADFSTASVKSADGTLDERPRK